MAEPLETPELAMRFTSLHQINLQPERASRIKKQQAVQIILNTPIGRFPNLRQGSGYLKI